MFFIVITIAFLAATILVCVVLYKAKYFPCYSTFLKTLAVFIIVNFELGAFISSFPFFHSVMASASGMLTAVLITLFFWLRRDKKEQQELTQKID